MLNNAQIERMLAKLKQLELTLEPYVFTKRDTLNLKKYETKDHLYSVPSDDSLFTEVTKGDVWGAERHYCWFKGSYTVPAELAGVPLYAYPHIGSYETMLWVDGVPFGEFAYKIAPTGHGNHYCDMVRLEPKAGETIELGFEAYAGHFVIGCYPFEVAEPRTFQYTFESIDICTKNQDIADFIFDLKALNQLASTMDKYSFRRGDVINCLAKVHETVYYSPEHTDEAIWREALKEARAIMAPCLAVKNSESAPSVGIIGHSHMDTAWLWDIAETIKKCARTYSNQLNLMEQYPEYRFIQSSAYHLEMMRRHYPELFKKIQAAVKTGRYEPNGAVWVECDCNITSGESMIRQFLWGQKYTQKYFDFTSDCFWLPDTFGYSAAIPQIMKGCNVDYFLTTKLSWNDTTTFPYETFKWEGIDGTEVFCHFNTTHNWPEPETLIQRTEGRGAVNSLQQKTVSDKRLVSYGFGDGGGGPQFEMIEMSRRCKDLDGCPKAEHMSVSHFMKDLEATAVNPNTYAGELYLELHRGTLTNQHQIKYNNRKAEIAIHNAEILTVANAVKEGKVASDEKIRPQLETLLVNQFHDILPGTCIQTAHEQSHKETTAVIANANAIISENTANNGDAKKVSVINTLSFDVNDVIYLDDNGCIDADDTVCQQHIRDLDDNKKVAVVGIKLPALSSTVLQYGDKCACSNTNFTYEGNKVTTPFATITFNEKGYIASYIDKANGRELVGNSYAFNTFLMAEDVPSAWDNWDFDADCQVKFKDSAELLSEEVISNGAAQLRIRRTYKLTELSSIKQDMIFNVHTPRIDFETEITWHDKRRFLKTAFDTTILSRQARHEIQFGYVNKPTTRNTETEQAMFEVVNHKYTDLSETKYGCAILNDCKYGISVEGGNMRLSLHKGGIRPDPRGDAGVHKVTYSFLPHNEAFGADSVIKPAYMANYKPIIVSGEYNMPKLVGVDAANIIIETIKPCEENERAFIVRLYEAEGTYTKADLSIDIPAAKVEETNMLEEVKAELACQDGVALAFKPFEIKTIKISY
ncbi:glycoside hydrolase family 38 C-terminal domain-containing protein [Paludicola sp. MB14-C6]|uniref:alpha-mannosidase n=1 Tax=Paludihabitans sp. MB14-C6 TaxID=3070656 RepID=UPI0027DD6A06|nr:glycoside hydrolase family 38 C-terminal domain-containing protein [Paludicola sp. MB14-C6]WMJ24063.1 glycoside hydrolase family 38 C-terminal domain-containing protein [Paludicola sp. MB14-C6]